MIQEERSRPLIAGFGEVYQPLKLGIGTRWHKTPTRGITGLFAHDTPRRRVL